MYRFSSRSRASRGERPERPQIRIDSWRADARQKPKALARLHSGRTSTIFFANFGGASRLNPATAATARYVLPVPTKPSRRQRNVLRADH